MDVIEREYIKRPMFWITALYAAGILICEAIGVRLIICLVLAGVFFAAYVLLKVFKRPAYLALFIALFFAGGAHFSYYCYSNNEVIPTECNVNITGTVYEHIDDGTATKYMLKDATVNGASVKGIILRSEYSSYGVGDIVSSYAFIIKPSEARYKGGFDDHLYCLAKGMSARAYSITDECIGSADVDFVLWWKKVAENISQRIDFLFGKYAGVAKALFMGETDDMRENVLENFRAAGLAHVLATSGLHVGFILAAIYLLIKILRLDMFTASILTIIGIVVYAGIAGFRISIMRAVFMTSLAVIGRMFGKRIDGYNIMATTLFAFILSNPAQMFDVGLQMSYFAVFAILSIAAPIKKFLGKCPDKLGDSISVSVSATIGVAPVSIAAFNSFSPYSVIVNIFAVPVAGAATILVMITVIASYIWLPIGKFIAVGASFVIYVLENIAELSVMLPGASVYMPHLGGLLAAAVAVICYTASKHSPMKFNTKAVVIASSMVIWFLSTLVYGNAFATDVYKWNTQSDSVLISSSNGSNILVDTGDSEYDAYGFVQANGISLSAVVITELNDEGCKGLKMLVDNGCVPAVYTSSARMYSLKKAVGKNATIYGMSLGDKLVMSEDMYIEVTQNIGQDDEKFIYEVYDKNNLIYTNAEKMN